VQQHVPDYDGDHRPTRRVRFRIGINVGDAIADGMDLHGDSVNVAVRLESQCPPGAICVSRAVRDHTGDRLGLRIEALGPLSLKNIVRPVEAFVLRLDGRHSEPDLPAGSVGIAAVSRPDKLSLAVLPFANMSADPDQEYFSDGIAEDIITELSRSRSLLVIARNSSFSYQGRSVDVRQIARDLGVRYVHEGSVRRSGERVRLTAQLIDAETGSHLWAERYDRTLADIFEVQDDIANSIVRAIQPEIALAEQQRAMRKPPGSVDTWEVYQHGLWHRARIDSTENQVARGFFERAIELDATFAPPYHALAQTYFDDALLYFTRTFAEAANLAEGPAHRALALGPNDADAYAVAALVSAARGDLATELARAEQALSLDPNCAVAYRIKGACLISSPTTRIEGCETLLRSLRLNPHDLRNSWIWNNLAVGRYLLKDYMVPSTRHSSGSKSEPEVFPPIAG
jgi:adenylate cyclase